MKPYPDSGRLTQEQRKFKFGELRSVVERAIDMLKACWRIALKRVEPKIEHPKKDCDCCVHFAQHLYEKDDLYGTDNNDSDDSSDDDNDGRIRLGGLIFKAY